MGRSVQMKHIVTLQHSCTRTHLDNHNGPGGRTDAQMATTEHTDANNCIYVAHVPQRKVTPGCLEL
jgi:hypothetical protein